MQLINKHRIEQGNKEYTNALSSGIPYNIFKQVLQNIRFYVVRTVHDNVKRQVVYILDGEDDFS